MDGYCQAVRVKRFESFDGTTICFHEWGSARNTNLPPVVLQHGFVADSYANWVQPGVVDALTDDGRWVIAVDARGHGASEKLYDTSRYGEAKMAQDLGALFDALGVNKVHLVGYSMGAVVSLLVASEDRRVSRLVVGGVGAGIVELGGVDTRAVPTEALVAALTTDDPGTIEHPGLAGFRALADAVGADRAAVAAQAGAMHTGEIKLDRITAPTLVLAGDADPLASRPKVLANAIRKARVRTMPGDHLNAVLEPAFADAVVSFLRS
ncbi:MAG: alpha/beta fold hydrolase [Pseudonocardiaceae bacterium]|nr:alpha/beta fold hydrolase [Pseudonocardiaceae bacterium]